MAHKIKIAIAEDQRPLRESLMQNLKYFDEVEVIFTAANGYDIVSKTEALPPEAILMDIEMPGMNGIEATAKIKSSMPDVKILMLTVFDDDQRIMEAILAGANGYLLKEERPNKIVEAIMNLIEGGSPMSAPIASKTLNLLRLQMGAGKTPKDEFGITDRELQVVTRMAEGQNYQQVSDSLAISPKTVRNHIQNIYKKLHVNSKVEAINKARQMGWL